MADTLVGRQAELDELRHAIDEARSGRGSVALLAGEPGIGKTRLATQVAEHARTDGTRVVWASCWDGPTAPLWPWTQVFRALIEHGSIEVPSGAAQIAGRASIKAADEGADAELARFALFDAAATYLKSEASQTPLLCVLDDLHWADASSLMLLEFLGREVAHTPLFILGTFRDLEVDPATDSGRALVRVSERADVLHLRGLDATDVAELLAQNTGGLASTEFARTVHSRTGGNPLFVRELARLLAAQHRTDPASVPVPQGVKTVIERRLARLAQPTFAFLGACSVLGIEFRVDLAVATWGEGDETVSRMLDEAVDARVIVPSDAPGRYGFTHALVRDVLYDGLSVGVRAAMHARAADAMEVADEHGYLAEISHHLMQTLPTGDVSRAADYAGRAGRRSLALLAYEDAAAHFARGLDALAYEPDDDATTQFLLDLGDANLRSGDMPAARGSFERAAEIARRRERPEDLARAALGFGAGLGGFEIKLIDSLQIELIEEALAALGPDVSPLRAWLLARLSVAAAYQESVERRLAVAEEAVEVARASADSRALAYALAAHCDAIAGPADSERRIEEASEIVRIAKEHRDRPLELLGHRLLVVAYLEMGDMAAAREQMRAFERLAVPMKQPLYLWYVQLWRALRALLRGAFDDALALADEAASVGARAHSDNARMLASVVHWMTAAQRRDLDKLPGAARPMNELVGDYGDVYVRFYDAWSSALRGDLDQARATALAVQGEMRSLNVDSEWLPGSFAWLETLSLVSMTDELGEYYERVLPFRHRFGVEGIGAAIHGSAEHFLGMAASALSRTDDAVDHLERAVERNRSIGAPVLAARSQFLLAQLLAARDPERSGRIEAEARATYEAFGVGRPTSPHAVPADAVFRREGDFWTLAFAGKIVRLRDVKGLHDIAKLIGASGREIAALDMHTETGGTSRASGEDLSAPGHAGELLDDEAREAYKARLAELEEDITEADELGDAVRAEKARAERDAIAHELASAYGLGGRARRAGDPSERARTAVTRRIREAISRVSDVHPDLGRHLKNSVRTGSFCSYAPEQPIDWDL